MSTSDTLIALLRQSHDELAAHVRAMEPDQFAGPSFCTDWSIGRVLSHLGSGAELAVHSIDAARTGGPQHDADGRTTVWARWNALSDADAAAAYLEHEGGLMNYLTKLTADEHEWVRVPFAAIDLSLAQFLSLRVSEHTLHRWDVEVMASNDAELAPDASQIILGVLSMMLPYLGKGANAPELDGFVIGVDLADQGGYTLDLTDGVRLTAGLPASPDATLTMPGQAFVRLCYGRLDPGHTPAGIRYEGKGSLEALRRLFPGV